MNEHEKSIKQLNEKASEEKMSFEDFLKYIKEKDHGTNFYYVDDKIIDLIVYEFEGEYSLFTTTTRNAYDNYYRYFLGPVDGWSYELTIDELVANGEY